MVLMDDSAVCWSPLGLKRFIVEYDFQVDKVKVILFIFNPSERNCPIYGTSVILVQHNEKNSLQLLMVCVHKLVIIMIMMFVMILY